MQITHQPDLGIAVIYSCHLLAIIVFVEPEFLSEFSGDYNNVFFNSEHGILEIVIK